MDGLDVKINDQQAHLRTVLEEIRINTAELSKTLSLREETKAQLEVAQKELKEVLGNLSDAREVLARTRQLTTELIEKTRKSADEIIAAAALRETASHKFADDQITKAANRIAELNAEAEKIEQFLALYQETMEAAINSMSALEKAKESVEVEIKQLREKLEGDRSDYRKEWDLRVSSLKIISEEVEVAEAKLKQIREQTDNTFKNLDEREHKVSVKEIDNEILRQRLMGLLREAQMKNK